MLNLGYQLQQFLRVHNSLLSLFTNLTKLKSAIKKMQISSDIYIVTDIMSCLRIWSLISLLYKVSCASKVKIANMSMDAFMNMSKSIHANITQNQQSISQE